MREEQILRHHYVKLLDKLIERSERWKEDADSRDDGNDYFYYDGQRKAFAEFRKIIEADIIKEI